jgi:hypothetical protein
MGVLMPQLNVNAGSQWSATWTCSGRLPGDDDRIDNKDLEEIRPPWAEA